MLMLRQRIISLTVVMAMISSYVLPAAAGPDDLKSAFSALKASMGEVVKAESDDKLDSALDDAFSPIPGPVEDSNIPLEKVDSPESAPALQKLATIPVQDNLNIEFENYGAALSLTLWSGARDSLKNLLTNIFRQLYSTNDPTNIRFVVNSSPIPKVSAIAVDFNDALRNQMQQEENDRYYKSLRTTKDNDKSSYSKPSSPPKVSLEKKPGVQIEITAGMMASLKNVDELAAQIARVLSEFNPTVYGVKEDTRFTRNQKFIEMISQIIDNGDGDASKDLAIKRDRVIAEFSAMERLAQGGFNPWALYFYEDRELSWMADVFEKSANHSLGRWLLKSKLYKLDDWSRPIRLQLQEHYMHYLQSVERGKGMNLTSTEFSQRLKFIRLRMKIFTKPFYSGLALQVTPIILGGGAVVAHVFFPEVAHWALTALNFTSIDLPTVMAHATASAPKTAATAATTAAQAATPETVSYIGNLITQVKQASQDVLDSSYLSFDANTVSEAVKAKLQIFYDHTNAILIGGGTVIVTAIFAKYADAIGAVFTSAAKTMEESKQGKSTLDAIAPEVKAVPAKAIEVTEKSVVEAPADKTETESESQVEPQNVEIILGTVKSKNEFAEKLGRNLAKFFSSVPDATANFYEGTKGNVSKAGTKMGQILVSSKDGLISSAVAGSAAAKSSWVYSVKKSIDSTVATKRALHNFAVAGIKTSNQIMSGTANLSVKSWHTLDRIARATPGAITKGSTAVYNGTVDGVVATGNYIGRVAVRTGNSTKRAGIATVKGIAYGSNIIFITMPIATGKNIVSFTKAMAVDLSETKAKFVIRRAKKKADKLEVKTRIANGKDRLADFFANEDLKPFEIRQAQKEFYDILMNESNYNPTGRKIESEKWGIAKSKMFKNVRKVFVETFDKWIKSVKKNGAAEGELVNMMLLMDNVYAKLSWTEKSDKRFKALMLEFYKLLLENPSEAITGWISTAERTKDKWHFIRDMMTLERSERLKSTKSAPGIVAAIAASGQLKTSTVNEIYKKNESVVAKWLGAPGTTIADFTVFFDGIEDYFKKSNGLFIKSRLEKSVYDLPAIERAKIAIYAAASYTASNGHGLRISSYGSGMNEKTMKFLNESIGHTAHIWVNSSKTITELAQKIEADTQKYGLTPKSFQSELAMLVPQKPELIARYADAIRLFETEYFWATENVTLHPSPLERPLMALLEMKRKEFGDSPAWKYDPIVSEKIHLEVKERLIQLKQWPTSFNGLEKTWKLFTSRGVSTITDDILSQLLKTGTTEQINALEEYAVRQGRVFDQGLRDEFAVRQLMKSEAYHALMAKKSVVGAERKNEINAVVKLAQDLMTDMGIRYSQFLEDLSNDIKSSYEEAEFIEQAKTKRFIDGVRKAQRQEKDSRISMLNDIIPHVKTWSSKNQYEFLLYLRGSIEATPFILEQFPAFGPERIRKIYQGLPIESAMVIVNLYLKETLLARKDVNQGYGKKLIDYLVSHGADSETKEYASLLLQGLLHGIDKANNKPFQFKVLSALIAMKPNENQSVGETLKLILEQFPGVGPKIGQFLVGTGLLPDDINRVLIKTQDQTLPPKRFDIYSDLGLITGRGKDLGINLEKLLGAGSLKYSVKGVEIQTMMTLVLQVFREDVQNSADLQIKVLNGMIEYLIKKGGKKWAFLQVVVDGAMNAVAREKRFMRESTKTTLAKARIYSNFSDADFTVAVPEQDFVNKRLLMARYAEGGSFFRLSKADQQATGLKILAMEDHILFSEDREVIWYDTDRHAGNYLIEVVNKDGKRHYMINPIDFGQLTYIRKDQRNKVIELFSYAAMLGKMGSNDWIAEKLAQTMEIPAAQFKVLKANLKEFFPITSKSSGSVVTHYFSLIAAINETVKNVPKDQLARDLKGGKLDFAYTDFVRAIIQLNQYEAAINIPAGVKSPRISLENKVKESLAVKLQEVVLSPKQELGIKLLNAEAWVKAKTKGDQFIPIDIRMSREELDKISIMTRSQQFKEHESSVAETSNTGKGEQCRVLLQSKK